MSPGGGEEYGGRPADALRMWRRAMRLKSPRPTLRGALGLDLSHDGPVSGRAAIVLLQETMRRNPNLISSHLHLGLQLLGQWVAQQSPSPGQTFGSRQMAAPRNGRWHSVTRSLAPGRGWISLYQQQYEQALAAIGAGVSRVPIEAPKPMRTRAKVLSRRAGRQRL